MYDDTIVSGATALEWERECRNPVRERQLCSGDVGFVTWRSSSYTSHWTLTIHVILGARGIFKLGPAALYSLLQNVYV